jgi:hypothetical protein
LENYQIECPLWARTAKEDMRYQIIARTFTTAWLPLWSGEAVTLDTLQAA